MQIELNELEKCKYDVFFIGDQDFLNKKQEIINDILPNLRNFTIPGFRKGKATDEVYLNYFKKQVNKQVEQSLLNEAYNIVISEKNIKPFGSPLVKEVNFSDTSFSCKFTLFTLPDFELNQYKGLTLSKPYLETPEEMTEKSIQDLRIKYANVKAFDENDFIQEGDQVIIDYQAYLDGSLLEDLNVQGDLITVGKSQIKGLDSNLFGMKLGEEREFVLSFEENDNFKYAGKTLEFKVKFVNGSKIILSALDDDFAKLFGFDTYQDLHNQIFTYASNRYQKNEFDAYTKQITSKLLENHSFELPSWIVSSQLQMFAKQNNLDLESLEQENKDLIVQSILDNIKISLILSKIRENEPEAQLTDEETINLAKTNFQKQVPDQNPDQILEQLHKNNQLMILLSRVKDEYVFDFIRKNSTIID